jgi:hypothetical protein
MTDMEGPEVNAHFVGPGDLKDGVQVRTGISIVTTPPQDIPIQLQLREGSLKKGLLDSISAADVVLKVKSKRKAYPRSEIRWVAIIRK